MFNLIDTQVSSITSMIDGTISDITAQVRCYARTGQGSRGSIEPHPVWAVRVSTGARRARALSFGFSRSPLPAHHLPSRAEAGSVPAHCALHHAGLGL